MRKILVNCMVLNGSRSGYRTIIKNLYLQRREFMTKYKIRLIFLMQEVGFQSLEVEDTGDVIKTKNFKNKWIRGLYEQLIVNLKAIKNDCDLIFMPATFGLLIPLRKSVTFIHTNTAFSLDRHLRGRSSLQQIAHNLLSVITFYTSTKLVFTSNTTKVEYENFLRKKSNGSIVGNGFDLECKDSIEPSLTLHRSYILCVGQIYKLKNFKVVMQALKDLRVSSNEWRNVDLVIVGSIQENDYYQELQEFDFVKHYSNLTEKEITSLYANATVFVQPSLFEGFSMTVAEALSFGSRVVISDIPTHREIYGEEAVQFFNPNSKDDLANKLRHIAATEKSNISEKFKIHFSHEEFHKRLVQTFNEI